MVEREDLNLRHPAPKAKLNPIWSRELIRNNFFCLTIVETSRVTDRPPAPVPLPFSQGRKGPRYWPVLWLVQAQVGGTSRKQLQEPVDAALLQNSSKVSAARR